MFYLQNYNSARKSFKHFDKYIVSCWRTCDLSIKGTCDKRHAFTFELKCVAGFSERETLSEETKFFFLR